MATHKRLICASLELVEQGDGLCFPISGSDSITGFVVRYQGIAQGYVNQCAHVPVPLDWQEGKFFDLTGHNLICATHGAQYAPETGECLLGPCKGKSLQKLSITEHDGNVYLIENKLES